MIRHTIKIGWWVLLFCLLLAAVLTGFRIGFPLLGQYQETLEQQLSESLGVSVEIGELKTEWHGAFPHIAVNDLSADFPDEVGPGFKVDLEKISFEINVWQSLIDLAPIFQKVDASGLTLRLEERAGFWLPNFDVDENSSLEPKRLAWIAKILMAQPSLEIKDSQLDLQIENGPLRSLKLDNILFENGSGDHQLSGRFWIPTLGEDSRLSFAIRTAGQTKDLSSLTLPFYLKVDRLGTEAFDLFSPPFDITDLDTSIELWGQLSGQRLSWLAGDIRVARALLPMEEGALQLIDSQTRFQLQPTSTGYQLQLNDTRLANPEHSIVVPKLAFDFHYAQDQITTSRAMSETIDLKSLSDWLISQPIGERLRSALSGLNPRGIANNLVIDFNNPESGPRLLTDLESVEVDAWQGVPALKGVSGLLDANRTAGVMHLDTNSFSLRPDGVYDEALTFESAEGRVNWTLSQDSVSVASSEMRLNFQGALASGLFSLNIPFDAQEQGMLSLQIGLKNANALIGRVLTPKNIVGEKLYTWLVDSIGSGEVDEAGLVVVTPLRRIEDRPDPSVELFLRAKNVDLDYRPPWPALNNIDGFVHFRDGGLYVQSHSADVLDQKISSALIAKSPQTNKLQIELALAGGLSGIDQFFRTEPLNNTVGAALKDWRIGGTHQSVLSLGIALDGSEPADVDVITDIEDGRFVSEAQRIDITDILGEINFDSASGISFEGLTGRFLDNAVTASAQGQSGKTIVQFKGEIDSKVAINWVGVPFDSILSGPANLAGTLTLCRISDCKSELQLESDLNKVRVNLPDYLAKEENRPSRLSLMLSLSQPSVLQVNYADRLRGRFQLGKALRGTLFLGNGGTPQLSEQSGLLVKGQLPELDITQLISLIDQLKSSSKPDQGGLDLRTDLLIDRAYLGSIQVSDLEADLRKTGDEWHLSLDGGAEGLIAWGEDGRYRVALSQLSLLPRSNDAQTQSSEIVSTEPRFIQRIPEMDLEVANFSWNGTPYGRWKGALRPRVDGVGLNQVIGVLPGVTFTGNADWNIGQYETSKIVLNYLGDDLGDTLVSFDEARLIETSELDGTLGLIWAGAPWHFAKSRLDGYLSFSSAAGRLIESGRGSGLLRLFGILNFNSLARRLKLDFSDLVEKGVVFDELFGEYTIQQGIVSSVKPLIMNGPSANLSASGQINLIDRTLDQKIDVALPLVGNTPLAAVLLGAPQVAGALFIIDKLIGDQIQKATSIVYRLRGPWSKPEAEVDTAAKTE